MRTSQQFRPSQPAPAGRLPGQPPRPVRRRRRYPALAWGALLVTMATAAVALRPGQPGSAQVPAAESGQLQITVVPAIVQEPEIQPQATGTRPRPDAPVHPDARDHPGRR